jgi:hypothetical protein
MRTTFRPALASLPVIRTLLLVLPCMIGAAAGALTYLASHSVPQALLASGSAAASSAQLFSQITGATPERPASGQDDARDDGRSGNIRQTKT